MKMAFLCITLALLLSCGKDDDCPMLMDIVCMENYDGPLDILWSVPLRPDTTIGNSIHPVIYIDRVLYSILAFDTPNTIYSFDKTNGNKQWEWEDLPYEGEVIEFNNPTQGYDDKFYFNYLNHKILINVEAPKTEWISERSFSDNHVSVGADHLYYVQFYDENNNGTIISSEIFRTPKIGLPNWESVYFEEGSLSSRLLFETPMEWISPSQDTLVIFSKSRVEVPTRSNLIAYNITQDKLEWELIDLAEVAFTTFHIPIIQGNLAYITNARTISCVDLVNGVELWETEDLGTGFSQCAPVLSDDKIFVNGDDGKMRAIHLNDGTIAWSEDYNKFGPVNMAYYEGGVYFCNASAADSFFFGVDANDGEIFWQEKSPNVDCKSSAVFSFGVSVDEETGRLYTLDGYFAMCLQLEPR